jgi:hypothetical protein
VYVEQHVFGDHGYHFLRQRQLWIGKNGLNHTDSDERNVIWIPLGDKRWATSTQNAERRENGDFPD